MCFEQGACGFAQVGHFVKRRSTLLPKPLIDLLGAKGFFAIGLKELDDPEISYVCPFWRFPCGKDSEALRHIALYKVAHFTHLIIAHGLHDFRLTVHHEGTIGLQFLLNRRRTYKKKLGRR